MSSATIWDRVLVAQVCEFLSSINLDSDPLRTRKSKIEGLRIEYSVARQQKQIMKRGLNLKRDLFQGFSVERNIWLFLMLNEYCISNSTKFICYTWHCVFLVGISEAYFLHDAKYCKHLNQDGSVHLKPQWIWMCLFNGQQSHYCAIFDSALSNMRRYVPVIVLQTPNGGRSPN